MSSISTLGQAYGADGFSSAGPGYPVNQGAGAAKPPTAASASAAVPATSAPTPDQVKAAVALANQQLDQSNHELSFVFDDKLGRMLVKIVDKSTHTVIRQVPSEEMLAAARALSGSATLGTLLHGKA